jgi:FG-GAP-like repeat
VTRSFIVNQGKPSGTLTAASGNPLAAGGTVLAIAVGDFNNDGAQDLAVTGQFEITVGLGNSAGGSLRSQQSRSRWKRSRLPL